MIVTTIYSKTKLLTYKFCHHEPICIERNNDFGDDQNHRACNSEHYSIDYAMLFAAIEFAARAHTGQYRKQTKIPYIVHPLAVAQLLIEAECSDEVAVAGLLHDTVEDSPVTLEDIRSVFGDNVAGLVAGATEPEKVHRWEVRKQHTLDSLAEASHEVLQLICADKLHNIRSIRKDIQQHGEQQVWSRFSRPKDKQKWYFQKMLAGLRVAMDGDKAGSRLLTAFENEVENLFGE